MCEMKQRLKLVSEIGHLVAYLERQFGVSPYYTLEQLKVSTDQELVLITADLRAEAQRRQMGECPERQ